MLHPPASDSGHPPAVGIIGHAIRYLRQAAWQGRHRPRFGRDRLHSADPRPRGAFARVAVALPDRCSCVAWSAFALASIHHGVWSIAYSLMTRRRKPIAQANLLY